VANNSPPCKWSGVEWDVGGEVGWDVLPAEFCVSCENGVDPGMYAY